MKGNRFRSIVYMCVVMMAALLVSIQPAAANNPGYWHDAAGNIWKDSHGHCWKTGTWKPEHAVAACESGAMAADADGDGVADDRDACPDTVSGASVDGTGCALDRDRDGVADHMDRCPDSARGVQVGANGCAGDADGDGVADAKDRCPGSAPGAKVDRKGCAKGGDADRDGIADRADQCPHTVAGVSVNEMGCELDSDGDGVVDSKDRCPGSARGTVVNGNGCEVDSDGDGVVNSMDRCLDTRSSAPVDTDGCELKQTIVLKGVTFDTGSATLVGESMSVLDRTAITLKNNANLMIEVAGYTDDRGAESFNRKLSQSRAVSVMNYLILQGVGPGSLKAKGYGPDSPIANNGTAAGRAENRRVELHLLK